MVAENPDIFLRSWNEVLNDMGDCSVRLYIPTYREEMLPPLPSDKTISAVIVVELIAAGGQTDVQALPSGVLFLRDQGVRMLQAGVFLIGDLIRGNATMQWFKVEDALTAVNFAQTAPERIEEDLVTLACGLAERPLCTTRSPYTPTAMLVTRWQVTNVFSRWIDRENWHTDNIIWLFLHLNLREPKSGGLAPSHRVNVIRFLALDAQNTDGASNTKDFDAISRMAFAEARSLNRLVTRYKQLRTNFRSTTATVMEKLCHPMQEVRERFHGFPFYTSCAMNEFCQGSISSAPQSLCDVAAMSKWACERRIVLDETFSTTKTFSRVYESASATWAVCERTFLRLYGNVGELEKELGASGQTLFKVERCRTLSDPKVLASHMVGMSTPIPRPDGPYTPVESRLLEAHDMCTPVWTVHRPSGTMEFYKVVPKGSSTVDALVQQHLDLAHKDGRMHEYLNGTMHWSSFTGDVDMKFPCTMAEADVPSIPAISRDCADMAERVFSTVFGFPPAAQYIFASAQDPQQPNKRGLHHHIRLPPGTVLTTRACRDMANLFNVARHLYPDSIGAYEDDIYDMAIYPGSSDQPRGHCLRSPFQSKMDGSRRLEPVLCSPAPPSRPEELLAHGGQWDGSGERVIFGRVVNKITGVVDLRDVPFFSKYEERVMDTNLVRACSTDARQVMANLNKRCVLFGPSASVGRLVDVVNDLWINSGGKHALCAHLRSTSGNEGRRFDQKIITNIRDTSKFVATQEGTVELRVGTGHLNICPRKPHRQPTKTQVCVGYSERMICMVLFVKGCFRRSCVERAKSLPSVRLQMPNIFISPLLEKEMTLFFHTWFVGPTVNVIRVVDDDDKFADEWDGEDEELVIHNGKGAALFVTDFRSCVRQLFAFLPDEALVMRLSSNLFMGCVRGTSATTTPTVYITDTPSTLLTKLAPPLMTTWSHEALTTAMRDA